MPVPMRPAADSRISRCPRRAYSANTTSSVSVAEQRVDRRGSVRRRRCARRNAAEKTLRGSTCGRCRPPGTLECHSACAASAHSAANATRPEQHGRAARRARRRAPPDRARAGHGAQLRPTSGAPRSRAGARGRRGRRGAAGLRRGERGARRRAPSLALRRARARCRGRRRSAAAGSRASAPGSAAPARRRCASPSGMRPRASELNQPSSATKQASVP